MALAAAGKLSKQIATEMGISEVTVKAHRHNVMKKIGAGTVADLVRIAGRLSDLLSRSG
jgi:FixJ family two-component response regulator